MKNTIQRQVHRIDATDQVLGRLATQVANILHGKNKPEFLPHLDLGDTVVIYNAKDIRLTGNKLENKTYYWHTGYPGGIRSKTAGEVMQKDPTELIHRAVYGMLPKNRLRAKMMKRLKIYTGKEGEE